MRGDYSNGKIYFVEPICEHEDNEFYYGSTIQKLCKRMDKHRSSYKSWKDGNYHKIMCFELFEKYGLENCKIYLVELYPCKSKEELEAREGYYIRNYDCVNKVIPNRTKKEYYCDNKDKILEYFKEYYNDNKDKVLKHNRQYYNDNKDKVKDIMKEYRINNKDTIVKINKEYYNKNKDKINTKHKVKYECLCGGRYTHINKLQHLKTKKHIKYEEEQK